MDKNEELFLQAYEIINDLDVLIRENIATWKERNYPAHQKARDFLLKNGKEGRVSTRLGGGGSATPDDGKPVLGTNGKIPLYFIDHGNGCQEIFYTPRAYQEILKRKEKK